MHRWGSLFVLLGLLSSIVPGKAQDQSVARSWNEQLLSAIRIDLARPPVHARNLFHLSAAIYDAWSAYDPLSDPFLLGRTRGTYHAPFNGVDIPQDIDAARDEAITYAAYRLLRHRFQSSPGAVATTTALNALIDDLGYDRTNTSTDYVNGGPAELGNYIAEQYIAFGFTDGSNEIGNYAHLYYTPANPPIEVELPGNPNIIDPNLWQQITVTNAVDQNGNPVQGTPAPVGHEWGNVVPFAMDTNLAVHHIRDGNTYRVYHDPGAPAYLDTTLAEGLTQFFKWSFCMVPIWQSHLDPDEDTVLDISPANLGNITAYPTDQAGYESFYDYFNGGTNSPGYTQNPVTGEPYEPQIVKRGDYARILAEFWADGPNSETPPGHWFSILHTVMDAPTFERKWMGQGPELNELEYDVKIFLALGGAMHDAAMSAWSIKGWYDYVRPVSAIRYMSDKGQCSDILAPRYHPAGLPLIPGYIEQVESDDPLAGDNDEHVGKIKLYTWRGPGYIDDPETDHAGVGWILAENWWPYQRPTFVTPPFSGYISGHSTFSRTAAEVLTVATGSPYFPGGLGVFDAPANEFLEFESGPSEDIELQWAAYRDASDQCSLSRIWGGIHPPVDDIPGRFIGQVIGPDAVSLANELFTADRPRIISIISSDSIVNIADIGSSFTVVIRFDRPMDSGVEPVIGYLVDDPTLEAIQLQSAQWTDAQTYSLTYSVLISELRLPNIRLRVTDAVDQQGIQQDAHLTSHPFVVDTDSPGLANATPNAALINDELAATEQFILTLLFTEACDTSSAPLITFANADVSATMQFDQANSAWMDPTQFVARFDLTDSGEELSDIGIVIGEVRDAAANPLLEGGASSLFEIDTRNPVLAPLVPDDGMLGSLDVGSSALTLLLEFDEAMDISLNPELLFPDDDPTISSLQTNAANSVWLSSSSYRMVYDLNNANEQLFNITAEVTQAHDLAGNAPEAAQFADLFIVDTKQAQVLSTVPVVQVVSNASVGTGGFHVDIEYDETMDVAFAPFIQITSIDPIGNSLAHSAGQSEWMDPTTYRAVFNVNDEEREAADLVLSISFARDIAGNVQLPIATSGNFYLDTKDPSVLVTTSNTYDVTSANVGPTGFNVISIFSEPMDQQIIPELLFDPPIAQNTLSLADDASSWLNTTTYQWQFDVGNVFAAIEPIAITVSNGRDQAENLMVSSTDPAYFSISLFVGIAEANGASPLTAFPNPVPAGSMLTLAIPQSLSNVVIQLIDGQGKVVRNDLHGSIPEGVLEYTLAGSAHGLYLLRLTSPEFIGHVKVLLE